MLHFIFVVLHASSALCVLHVSIPILQTREDCPVLKLNASVANSGHYLLKYDDYIDVPKFLPLS